MWRLRLPDNKSVDQTDVRVEASDGYATYLRLWKDLFAGRLPTIRDGAWTLYIEYATQVLGGVEQAVSELEMEIASSWRMHLDELGRAFSPYLQNGFIHHEFKHRTPPGYLAQRLIILAACENLGVTRDASPLQGMLPFSF